MTARRLRDRVVAIFGGGDGIGEAIVRRCVDDGARVVCLDVDGTRAEQVAASAGAVVMTCDVTVTEQVATSVAAVVDQFGRLDGAVDVVGMWPAAAWKPLDEVDDQTWALGATLVLDHAYRVASTTIGSLADSGGGAIVFIGSISGTRSAPRHGPYGAAKAGLVSLAATITAEQGHRGVRANVVSPGIVGTPRVLASASPDDLEAARAVVPLGRLGTPDDIAATVAFLLSDDAAYISGVDIPVDGGALTRYPFPPPRMQHADGRSG